MSRAHFGWLAVVATLGAAAPPAGQQPEPAARATNDRWTISVAPYLWAAAMDGHAAVAGTRSDVDVPFKDTPEGPIFRGDARDRRAQGPLRDRGQ